MAQITGCFKITEKEWTPAPSVIARELYELDLLDQQELRHKFDLKSRMFKPVDNGTAFKMPVVKTKVQRPASPSTLYFLYQHPLHQGGGKDLYLRKRYTKDFLTDRYYEPQTGNMESGWHVGRRMMADVRGASPTLSLSKCTKPVDPDIDKNLKLMPSRDQFYPRMRIVEKQFRHKQPLLSDCIQLTHPRCRDPFSMPEYERL